MIRKTLFKTQLATYAVLVPHEDPKALEVPIPIGTGFFISKDGYFITARHVLYRDDGTRIDPKKIMIMKPTMAVFRNPEFIEEWPEHDLVLLKYGFTKTGVLANLDGFPFLEICFDIVSEGTPVYAFGYPLSTYWLGYIDKTLVGAPRFSPRTTSAIISSHHEMAELGYTQEYPRNYVIDKALNYGNSGGPIVVQETGKVISVCSRFQPVEIQQDHLPDILMPSLYGVTSSLKNIEKYLRAKEIGD